MKIKILHVELILVCLFFAGTVCREAFAQGTSDKKSEAGPDVRGQNGKEAKDARLPWEKETGLKQHMMLTRIKGSRKIDIHPVKQAEGITTGLVIAYGHVISPPYKFEYQGKKLFVNGVQVRPSLVLEREPRQLLPLLTRGQAEATFKGTQIQRAAQELYSSGLKTKPLKEVQAEIVALVMKSTDVFLRAEWISDRALNAKEVVSGAVSEMRFSADPPVELTPKESQRREEENARWENEELTSRMRRVLGAGHCWIFLSQGTAGDQGEFGIFGPKVNQIMAELGLTREQRIEKIKAEVGRGRYEFALDVVDNYDPAEWKLKE
ncbi:MAG: hypothetical protein HY926_06315 [Elusimicrobia bacterium]|nr:hypothetical protein [Elusimicrobiota bacterium]